MDGHARVSSLSARTPYRLPLWLGFLGALTIALFLLWGEHRVHVLGALPYVLLLLCPAMHLFMHGGHGKQASGDQDEARRPGDHT
jgi:hypothetical protein